MWESCRSWLREGARLRESARLGKPFTLAVAALCCVLGTAVAGSGAATAATAASAATATARPHPTVVKPKPVRPPSSPNASTGKVIPRKPSLGTHARPMDPAGGWTVSLSESNEVLWPTQYSTLTATANADVGPSPYYISIFDATTGTLVAVCGSGTTCSVSETEPTASYQDYIAYIDAYSSTFPPADVVATSANVAVVWESVSVSLAASPTTLGDGATSTLTATASADVGPSPFYIEIFDVTTGTELAICGEGATCTASVSEPSDTTQEYVAYVSDYGLSLPLSAVQATSVPTFVTWTSSGWQVSLSGPGLTYSEGTYTATTNGDVGPTPYYIEIFDETTGTMLTQCPSGSSCSVTFGPSHSGDTLVAFVSSYGSTLPPANIQATSNQLFTYFQLLP